MLKGLMNFKTIRSASTMLKTRAIATDLLKKRVEDKSRSKNLLIVNDAYFQLIGGDYQGFRPSLLVHSEGNSYLFNCGDGLQRYCYSSRITLKKLENLFVTTLEWDRVSGVHGLSLTLQDMGAPELCIHAGEGINDLFGASKSFMVFDSGMKCSTKIGGGIQIQDPCITIRSVLLEKPVSLKLQSDSSNSTKKPKHMTKIVAYLCSLPDLPGQLNPDKCKELKVPVGRQLAILKSGQDITLPDGRFIKSVDVCSPRRRGLNFLVLECPKPDDIESFTLNETLSKMREAHKSDSMKIDMVFHFTPEEVTKDSRYQDWVQSFSEDCRHFLLSNDEGKRVNFVDSYRLQYLLQRFDSEIFPSLYLPSKLVEQSESEQLNDMSTTTLDDVGTRVVEECDLDKLAKVVKLDPLDKITVRPCGKLQKVDASIAIDVLYREAQLQPEFERQFAELQDAQRKLPVSKDYEPEVVFLGTGSALPGKYRNTSCILFNINHPQKLSMIMDCGEDSYGQLYRFYGPEKLVDVLKELKLIYVSHQHADHHVGLVEILRQRRKLTRDPVALLLPPGLEDILRYHNENFEDLSGSYRIFLTSHIKNRSAQLSSESIKMKALKQDLKMHLNGLLEDVTVVGVEHCVNACAVVFKFKIGHPEMRTFTVSYSGDARPCKEFVIAGRNSDLLIHEATFDYRSQDDALAKKHCTSTEAIQVAKQMHAKYTILTHFSARLAKIPYFTEDFDESIGFAFDNLSLKCPSHFPRLPIMKKILTTTFKRSLDTIDEKYRKQETKQQLLRNVMKYE